MKWNMNAFSAVIVPKAPYLPLVTALCSFCDSGGPVCQYVLTHANLIHYEVILIWEFRDFKVKSVGYF